MKTSLESFAWGISRVPVNEHLDGSTFSATTCEYLGSFQFAV